MQFKTSFWMPKVVHKLLTKELLLSAIGNHCPSCGWNSAARQELLLTAAPCAQQQLGQRSHHEPAPWDKLRTAPGNSQGFGALWLFLQELTDIVGHEIRGEALGPVAHGGVIVSVPSEHQHGPTDDHSRVQVAEEPAVFENSPSETKCVLMRLLSTWQRQNTP